MSHGASEKPYSFGLFDVQITRCSEGRFERIFCFKLFFPHFESYQPNVVFNRKFEPISKVATLLLSGFLTHTYSHVQKIIQIDTRDFFAQF